MKARLAVVLAVAFGMLMGTQLFAHHGTGISYDMKKTVTVKGVITKFAFQNPHSQLYFDVKDDSGNITHWAAEMRAPGNLEANGYTRKGLMEKLAPGADVAVTGNPSKAVDPFFSQRRARASPHPPHRWHRGRQWAFWRRHQ